MGVTNGISGNGNNHFKVSDFWAKPSLQAAKTEQTKVSEPIKLTSDNVKREDKREELGFINPYGSADATITSAREIALNTNDIMAKLGYPNFKVTPKTVAGVTESVNGEVLPALNNADDNAVAARVATPNGPFAELFT